MMTLELKPGRYVLAVSGGIDSVSLLDMAARARLGREKEISLVVAHFDHGIRAESTADRQFVGNLARQYRLPFIYDRAELGPNTSEATARQARYKFLQATMDAAQADAILTAHHLDDWLETAVINLLRGTGRRGLTSLHGHERLRRPLLGVTKQQIRDYAAGQGLVWRDDSTNNDEKYLRNYVRRQILPRFSAADRQQFLAHLDKLNLLNRDIDQALVRYLQLQTRANKLNRQWFTLLPHDVARDVLAGWLRAADVKFDKKMIEKLVIAAKTLHNGKSVDVDGRFKIVVDQRDLALVARER